MGGLGPRAPLRARVGLSLFPFILLSLSLVILLDAGKWGIQGRRETRDEEVGRPTTLSGACPESARIVYYMVRLITSRGYRFLFRLFVSHIRGGSI